IGAKLPCGSSFRTPARAALARLWCLLTAARRIFTVARGCSHACCKVLRRIRRRSNTGHAGGTDALVAHGRSAAPLASWGEEAGPGLGLRAGPFFIDIRASLAHFPAQSDGPWKHAAALHMIQAAIWPGSGGREVNVRQRVAPAGAFCRCVGSLGA